MGVVYIALLTMKRFEMVFTTENWAKIDHFTLFIKYDYTLAAMDAILNMSECLERIF